MEDFNYQAHLDFIQFIKENFKPHDLRQYLVFYFDNVEYLHTVKTALCSKEDEVADYLSDCAKNKKSICFIGYDSSYKDWVLELDTEFLYYIELLKENENIQNDIKTPFKYIKPLVTKEMDELIDLLINGKKPAYRPSNC